MMKLKELLEKIDNAIRLDIVANTNLPHRILSIYDYNFEDVNYLKDDLLNSEVQNLGVFQDKIVVRVKANYNKEVEEIINNIRKSVKKAEAEDKIWKKKLLNLNK